MWQIIVTALLPIFLELITTFLIKKPEAKRAWINFLEAMQQEATASNRLRKSSQRQLERLKKMCDES